MLCYLMTYSNLHVSYSPSTDQDGIRHIYIYIYLCMCVCVCVCTSVSTWVGLFVFDLYIERHLSKGPKSAVHKPFK